MGYVARDTDTGTDVAVKLEDRHSYAPMLEYGAKVLQMMQGIQGFAKFHYFGEESTHRCLVMQKLGSDLENQQQRHGGPLPPEAVARIAEQVLGCLEHLNSKGFIHRDIK